MGTSAFNTHSSLALFTLEVLTRETSSSEKLFPIPQACQINTQGLPAPSEENMAKSGLGTKGLYFLTPT